VRSALGQAALHRLNDANGSVRGAFRRVLGLAGVWVGEVATLYQGPAELGPSVEAGDTLGGRRESADGASEGSDTMAGEGDEEEEEDETEAQGQSQGEEGREAAAVAAVVAEEDETNSTAVIAKTEKTETKANHHYYHKPRYLDEMSLRHTLLRRVLSPVFKGPQFTRALDAVGQVPKYTHTLCLHLIRT